jgi:hypothetical protein
MIKFGCVVNAVQDFHHRFEREGCHFEHCNFFNKHFCTLNFLFIIRICRFVELRLASKKTGTVRKSSVGFY